MGVFKEKCMELKDKLIKFKEEAIHGFRYLDGIVYDEENHNTMGIEGLKGSINSFMWNIKERSEKIKVKINLIKGNLEGTPVAGLFQKLADKFEECKEAFKPRWEGFIGAIKDLENGKEDALDALKKKIRKGKEECKEVLEKVKTQAIEIEAKLVKIQMEMVAKMKSIFTFLTL